MKEKIRELRKLISIPMNEAMALLKKNDEDVTKSFEEYKQTSLQQIVLETGCSDEMALEFYEKEKYDFNRTISFIKEELFDLNYTPIKGLEKEDLQKASQWLGMIEDKGFAYSLDYLHITDVIIAFGLLSTTKDTASLLQKAKSAQEHIFEGYSDAMPIAEFVKRHRKLDKDTEFQAANEIIPLRITVLKQEIARHYRNMI